MQYKSEAVNNLKKNMKIVAFENSLNKVRLESFVDKNEDGVNITMIDHSKPKSINMSIVIEYDDLVDFIASLNEFRERLDEDLEEEYEEDEEQ